MSTPIERMSIADQVRVLGGTGRGGGTRKLAEARAAASGKSVRTEMRAVQRALKAGKPPAKQAPEVARAGASSAASAALRGARSVRVGVVKVSYRSKHGPISEGTRDLGSMDVSGELADALASIADELDAGRIDLAQAQEQIGEALMDEYGGIGGTVDISDYVDGLEFR